jgi:predicted RNase H-like HicB family nuclease
MKSHIFKVVVEEDKFEDGRKAYHAWCPSLKGCHSWGQTHEEALAKIQEAVELYIEDLREAGESIPVDPEKGAIEWPTPSVVVNV